MGRNPFIIFLLLLYCCLGFSQTSSSLPVMGGNGTIDRGGYSSNLATLNLINSLDKIPKTSVYENIEISDIEGSMFYESNFKKGIIYLNGEQFAILQVRYNALNDDMEVKMNNNLSKLQILTKIKSVSCKKGNDHFVFKEYFSKNGDLSSGYLIELISGGKYRLYEKRGKIFKEGSDAKTSFHKSTPHRFLNKMDFFISKEENTPVYTKATKKDVLSILDKEESLKLKQFLKNKKGLDFNKKEELMGIIAYVNSQ